MIDKTKKLGFGFPKADGGKLAVFFGYVTSNGMVDCDDNDFREEIEALYADCGLHVYSSMEAYHEFTVQERGQYTEMLRSRFHALGAFHVPDWDHLGNSR